MAPDGWSEQALRRGALRRDLRQSQDQLGALEEVLRALGRRRGPDFDDVFGTIVESAKNLCRADAAQLYLVDGDVYRLAWHAGVTDEYLAFMDGHPISADRGSLVGRVVLEQRSLQITDVLADPDYRRPAAQALGHFRTIMGAPMIVEDEVVGVLSVWRTSVDGFADRSARVLTAFAAQAAVAVRTVDLMRELEQRTDELAVRVDQLEALSAVGEAVSASLDLDEVLATIITHAVALSETDGGSIFEFDPDQAEFRLRATFNTEAELQDALGGLGIGLYDTLVGRAARERRPLQVSDLTEAADDVHLRTLRAHGWLSLVAVPMIRQERIIGALVVRRHQPGEVDAETLDFLQTFATQSSLALANAQLFRRLERQSAELAVASQHKSDFLASMSHELRTPLNAVIGFSEVLLDRMVGELNERQDEYLHDILASGRHLLALLNDVLDLSKVEAGRMALDLQSVDVADLLASTVVLVGERAQRQGLDLRVDTVEPGLFVVGDQLRLRQVVLNLVTNAVKFTPSGGQVRVRAAQDGDAVTVTVTDTGPGIPEADRNRIFESFQQGGRSPASQEGTGLGLTLSRRIVELHGGRLWLDTEVGRGSTFGFSVPRARPVDAGDAPDEPAAAAVLVVEDDARSASLLTALLRSRGLVVDVVCSGEAALEQLAVRRPLAIVLDIQLPGMDGWDVLDRVKGDPATADIPVIVVSVLDERGRALALGAMDHLVKPVSRDLLLAAVSAAAAERGGSSGEGDDGG